MRSLCIFRNIRPLLALAALLPVPATADVLYVRADAPATGCDGRSWATACPTIQGVFPRGQAGDEVWVAAGVYTGPILVPAGWSVYGGFAGTETARDQRDPAAHETVLQGAAMSEGVLGVLSGATNADVVDGFTITRGSVGVGCVNSSPTVRGNRITGNGQGVTAGGRSDSPVIVGNRIDNNKVGVFMINGSVSILGNVILNNRLGIDAEIGSVVIANNVIARSSAPTGGSGQGIYLFKVHGSVANNTLTDNASASLAFDSVQIEVANNILAFSNIGLATIDRPENAITLRNNAVYGNQTTDYTGITDPTGTDGNLRADPRFVDRAGGNVRLLPSSPLIDAGYDAAVQGGWMDADGKPRIQGPHVDIGAYEAVQGTGASLVDAARALMAAGGLRSPDAAEKARLDVETAGPSQGVVDLQDAARLARKAAGLDPNP